MREDTSPMRMEEENSTEGTKGRGPLQRLAGSIQEGARMLLECMKHVRSGGAGMIRAGP